MHPTNHQIQNQNQTKQYLPVMKLVSLLLTSRSVQAIQAIQNTCIFSGPKIRLMGKHDDD